MTVLSRTELRREYVWELPVRYFHWINVLLITAMFWTGLYIGWPVLAPAGEPWNNATMAWVRYVHFLCGYCFLANWFFRIYWFFAGNENAKNIFRFWSARAWRSVYHHTRTFLLADPETPQVMPIHDQLARMWHGIYFTVCMFMIFTGFAMYGESNPHHWTAVFTKMGWKLMGTSRNIHYWHHLAAWFFPFFVIAHLYQVLRTDMLARQGLVSSMISGYYLNWDSKEEEERASRDA